MAQSTNSASDEHELITDVFNVPYQQFQSYAAHTAAASTANLTNSTYSAHYCISNTYSICSAVSMASCSS